jgi:hypothetical protein
VTPIFIEPFDIHYRNAIVQQWNVNVQRELFGTYLFTVAYVGSKGNHLESGYQLNPARFGIPGTLQERRPLHPYFSTVNVRSSQGNHTYHSLQITMNKRLARGFTILADYTWAKLIDIGNPIDGISISREKALSGNGIEHRFVASYIWELPRLRNQPPVIRHVLGGWETNGIITLETGLPFNVTSGRDNSGTGINSDRPDLIGDPRLSTGRSRGEQIARYFNTAAFAQNPAGTFGTAGRNLLIGPGEATVDFGVVKNVFLRERYKVTFRMEAFNLFNRVNLNNPNSNLNAGNVATITGAGDPRVIQMALRFQF